MKGHFNMRNIIQVLFILILMFGLYSCQSDDPLQPTDTHEKAALKKQIGESWTVYVKYPYTTSETVNDPLSHSGADISGWASISYPANGISGGNYYMTLKPYSTGNIYYAFPNGVSGFDGSYDLSVSSNAVASYITWISYPQLGSDDIAYFNPQTSSNHFSVDDVKFAWVKYNPIGQSVNKWYTKNPSTVDVSYTASGYCKKSDSGSGPTSFSIDMGVSGVSVNDLIITDNNPNLAASHISVNGTVVTGIMGYY